MPATDGVVMAGPVEVKAGESVSLSGLPHGIYVVKLGNKPGQTIRK